MIRACILILLGGFAAQHNRVPHGEDLIALLIVAALTLILVRKLQFAGFFLLGFGLFLHAAATTVDARIEPKFVGDSLLTQVRILDFPKVRGNNVTMLVAPVADSRLPSRSRVSWFDAAELPVVGDVWQLELRLRRPRGNSNPGGFDLEAWMFRENIHAAGYVVNGPRNKRLQRGAMSWRDRIRAEFVRQIRDEIESPIARSILPAVGVGTRHLITDAQWERYAVSGTSHLIAISGLHVGLAAAAVFIVFVALSGALRLPGNHLDQAIIAGAMAAFLYAYLSGLAVPSRRATIMLLIVAIGFVCRRRAEPARIVAISALTVFVIAPLSSMSPGFQLSFGAVIVLLWFSRRLTRSNRDLRRFRLLRARLGYLVALQCALLTGLIPLTVVTFHRIALLAPIANLLVVPIFSIVTVPATLSAMLLRNISTFANTQLLQLAAVSVDIVDAVIVRVAALPLADLTLGGIDGSALCLLLLPLLWVILPRGWPGRWIAVLGVIAILFHRPATPRPSCFGAHILDVGQGLATVIQTRHHTMIFDTGDAYHGGGSAAERIVLPFLRHHRIDRIDWLIVSHADSDHSGGVASLIEHLDVSQLVVGEAVPGTSRAAMNCVAGQKWEVDGVEIRVLYPARGGRASGNDASCVVEIGVGKHRFLLTGDIEASAERKLLQSGRLRSVDVVAIPHHGSATSSTPAFVNRLAADIAIVSAGYRNRWGFPKPQVVDRWRGAGTEVLDTANSGAISFMMCADEGLSRLRQHRVEQFRFWRDLPAQ